MSRITVVDPIASQNFQITANRAKAILSKVQEIYNSTARSRIQDYSESTDPRRNIYDDCGYPETDQIRLEHYRDQYERNPYARKVVELYPRHCWQLTPSVFEDQDPDVETEFEKTFNERIAMLEHEEHKENWP